MLDGRPQDIVNPTAGDAEPSVARAAKKPVLLVLHQQHSNPGHVGHWFRRNGYDLDIRRHFEGAPLPSTLAEHSGAVIFGGPQSANDDLDYIRREIDWIGVSLKESKPFLGICLGAQMLARYLGGRVDHCRHGSVEIGYHEIRPTQAGEKLDLPKRVYQWHREGFDLPRDGVLLATSDGAYPNQAFQYDSGFGLQFHPEITFAQVNRWSGSNSMRLLMRGARPRHEQMEVHLTQSAVVHSWLDGFMRRWISGALANR